MALPGWILMIGSVGSVLALLTFCFYRILTTPRTRGHMHAPLDIETHERME